MHSHGYKLTYKGALSRARSGLCAGSREAFVCACTSRGAESLIIIISKNVRRPTRAATFDVYTESLTGTHICAHTYTHT